MEGQVIIADGEKYAIINLIAKGKGGYNYLAITRDTFVVVKQIHYEPCDYYLFEDNKLNSELRDYKTLYDLGIPMPKLLFSCQERQLLIKEHINGETLARITANGQMQTSYIAQIFEMCKRLYPNRLNIDYFPTNFIEQNGIIYYVDYECSKYAEEWNFENWGIYFLANQSGMKNFVEREDDSLLLENGKPVRNEFEDIVKQWLTLR